MSYERPQNNDAQDANWQSDQHNGSAGDPGNTGHDPNLTGEASAQRDGGPRGNVYDPSSEPPQYGVRVQGSDQGGQSGNGYSGAANNGDQSWNPQQPWAADTGGAAGTGAGQYGQGQGSYGQNPYGQNSYGQGTYAQDAYREGQNPYGQGSYNQGQHPYGNQPQNYYSPDGGGGNQNPYDQPYAAPPVTPGRGWAIASVVLGAISILLFFLGLTVVLAVLGLIFAIVALVKVRKAQGARKGMSITGLVLNILGLILSGIALVFWVVVGGMTWQILQDPAAQECMSQYMEDQNQAAYERCLEETVNDQFGN